MSPRARAALVSLTLITVAVIVAATLVGRSDDDEHPVTSTQASTPAGAWPEAASTGLSDCPEPKVTQGSEIVIDEPNTVLENVELRDAVINVKAPGVVIRCVRITGSGYFGIDNTATPDDEVPDLVIDRVEIDCRAASVGLLIKGASVSRADISGCADAIRVAGSDVTISGSYCHDLYSSGEDLHADCIQSTGGTDNLVIENNSLWGWDTSDILLGLEGGESRGVIIRGNRLMSDPDREPAPAFLTYVSGSDTQVTDNRFSRRFTYGPCTLIGGATAETIRWSGNVWDDDGSALEVDACT